MFIPQDVLLMGGRIWQYSLLTPLYLHVGNAIPVPESFSSCHGSGIRTACTCREQRQLAVGISGLDPWYSARGYQHSQCICYDQSLQTEVGAS